TAERAGRSLGYQRFPSCHSERSRGISDYYLDAMQPNRKRCLGFARHDKMAIILNASRRGFSTALRRNRSRGFLNQFPTVTQMFFGRENITKSEANSGPATQFGLI